MHSQLALTLEPGLLHTMLKFMSLHQIRSHENILQVEFPS